jgi:hypothetical protein
MRITESPGARPGTRTTARWTAGTCQGCGHPILQSDPIVRTRVDWIHDQCHRPRDNEGGAPKYGGPPPQKGGLPHRKGGDYQGATHA